MVRKQTGALLHRSNCLQVVADALMRVQLNTMDEERVNSFETDPCAMADRYAPVDYNGAQYYRYSANGQTNKACFRVKRSSQCMCI